MMKLIILLGVIASTNDIKSDVSINEQCTSISGEFIIFNLMFSEVDNESNKIYINLHCRIDGVDTADCVAVALQLDSKGIKLSEWSPDAWKNEKTSVYHIARKDVHEVILETAFNRSFHIYNRTGVVIMKAKSAFTGNINGVFEAKCTK